MHHLLSQVLDVLLLALDLVLNLGQVSGHLSVVLFLQDTYG